MATTAQFIPGTAEVATDFAFPQREAAFFYGLFLRGHSPEQLRRDIEVPTAVLAKWHREAEKDPSLRDILYRIVEYRRHVLAIFDSLVGYDTQKQSIQEALRIKSFLSVSRKNLIRETPICLPENGVKKFQATSS